MKPTMRVLLDEQLDRRLKRLFGIDFQVQTVEDRGWKGKKNGELLQAAHLKFDALVTMDKGIEYQQNLGLINMSIIVLLAKTNRYRDIAPLIPKVTEALRTIRAGQLVRISM
jgi:hypothetical protein